jgi:putative hydrolase of the HAD superfamily
MKGHDPKSENRSPQSLPVLILDADDTLWETEIYYEQAVAGFGDLMAMQGFDREEAERTVDDVEKKRIPLVGYSPREFANNLVVAYEWLCERYGRSVEETVAEEARTIGRLVVDHPIELIEGVAETLPRLRERFRLLLLTKGDADVQELKLARSGLAHLFDAVHVVPEKDAGVLRDMVARYGLVPERTWMVGNSPRSDVNPALEAGIGAIHVPHANTWSLEEEEIVDKEKVIVLGGFGDLVRLLPGAEGADE